MCRKFIYLISIFSFISNSVFAQNDTLTVVHLSDIHICNLSSYHPEFVNLRQHYGNGAAPLAVFSENKVRQLGADVIIITGDLIDYFGAESSDGNMLETQIEQFVPLYFGSRIPMYLTLGNHDITTYWINDNLDIEQSQLEAQRARAAWIRNVSCFQEGTYYSRAFQIDGTTYRFLFLDNGYSLGNGAYLDKPQLDWLDGQVKQFTDDPMIIFMHKYLPVADINEDSVFFTKNETITLDEQTCSQGLLKTLNENPNIKAIFCGHGHKNVGEWLTFPSGHKILQTETAGFANDRNNWRMLKFTGDQIIIDSTGTRGREYVIEIN